MCLNLTWACHDMYDTEAMQGQGSVMFLQQFLLEHKGLYPEGCRVVVSDFTQFTAAGTTPRLHPFLALINESQRFAILAFRPTVSNTSWADVFADLQGHANHSDYEGSRHAGFAQRAESVPIYAALDWIKEGYRVYITGHSLGGAVAQLFTCRLIQRLVLNGAVAQKYTDRLRCLSFGTPNVADAAFWTAFAPWVDVFHTYVFRFDGIFRLAIGTVATIKTAADRLLGSLAGVVRFVSGQRCSQGDTGQVASFQLHPHGSAYDWLMPEFALFGSYHFMQSGSEGVVIKTLGGRATNGQERELDRLLGLDLRSKRKLPSQRALEFLEENEVLGKPSRSLIITLRDLKDHGCYPFHVNQLVAATFPHTIGSFVSAEPLLMTSKAALTWGLTRVAVVAKANFYSICFSGLLAGFVTSVYPPHELWPRTSPPPTAAPFGMPPRAPSPAAARPPSPGPAVASSSVDSKARFPKPLIAPSVAQSGGAVSLSSELWPTVSGSSECNNRGIYAIALPSTFTTQAYLKDRPSFFAKFNCCLGQQMQVEVSSSVHPLDDEMSLQHEPIDVLFVCYWELLLSDSEANIKQLGAPMAALLQAVDKFGNFGDFQTGELDNLFAQFFARRHASRISPDPHKYFLNFLQKRLPSQISQVTDVLRVELADLYEKSKHRDSKDKHRAASAAAGPTTIAGDGAGHNGHSGNNSGFVPTPDARSAEAAADEQARQLHEFLCAALHADFPDIFDALSKGGDCGVPSAPSAPAVSEYRAAQREASILSFEKVLDDLVRFRRSQLPDDVRNHFAFSIVPMYAMAIKFQRLQIQVDSLQLAEPPTSYLQSIAGSSSAASVAAQASASTKHSINKSLAHARGSAPSSPTQRRPHVKMAAPLVVGISFHRIIKNLLQLAKGRGSGTASASQTGLQEDELYELLRSYGSNALEVAAMAVLASLAGGEFLQREDVKREVQKSAWVLLERVYADHRLRDTTYLQRLVTSDAAWAETFTQGPLLVSAGSSLHRPFWVAAIQAMVSLHELRVIYMTSPDKVVICGPQKSGKSHLFKLLSRTKSIIDATHSNTRVPFQLAVNVGSKSRRPTRVHLLDTPAFDDLSGLETRMWNFSAMTARCILITTTLDNINSTTTSQLLRTLLDTTRNTCRLLLLLNKVDLGLIDVERQHLLDPAADERTEHDPQAILERLNLEEAVPTSGPSAEAQLPEASVSVKQAYGPKIVELWAELSDQWTSTDLHSRIRVKYCCVDGLPQMVQTQEGKTRFKRWMADEEFNSLLMSPDEIEAFIVDACER